VFSALYTCLKFRSDRIVSTRIRRSYVTRARIALLTSTSIHSRCKRRIEAAKVYKCLRAIDSRAIHFYQQYVGKHAFRFSGAEVQYAAKIDLCTRKSKKRVCCFNYTEDCEITPKRCRNLFRCNWLVYCIKHSHMFNFDAEITRANEFSVFNECFLRSTCIMNITFANILFLASEWYYEPFKSYMKRLNCNTSLHSSLLCSKFICHQIPITYAVIRHSD